MKTNQSASHPSVNVKVINNWEAVVCLVAENIDNAFDFLNRP